MQMKRTPALLLLLLAVIAQEAPPLFTSTTNSVLVDVAVATDQRPAPELQREDFLLLDNGEPRPIAGIAHDELPLDIVLVCQSPLRSSTVYANRDDVIGAYSPDVWGFSQRLMDAAGDAVFGLRAGDRVAIVSYGRDPRIALRFTDNRKAIAAGIKALGNSENADENIVLSSEALAIEYGVRMLADVERDDPNARTGRRRLIVMISNVFGAGTRYADEPVIRRLWDQNIVFSVIDDAPPARGATTVQRTGGGDSQTVLFQRYNPIHIAQATGGDRIVALEARHPGDILAPIRQRYTLWFNQPSEVPTGESRSIRVDLSEAARRRFPKAIVRAREGYVTR
jgi:hypothetical protein